MLKINELFCGRCDMGQISVITSGKGGTGKSTFSVGIASAFAKMNKKVLLIDLDAGLRCLDLMLGVSSDLVFDISDILSGNTTFDQAILNINDEIDLIAAPENDGQIDYKNLFDFVTDISGNYDEIILDCPAGIDISFFEAIPKYTDVYVVEQLNRIGTRSAAKIETILTENKIENKFLVLNKFDYYLHKDKFIMSLDEIMDATGLMLKGIIPYDDYLDSMSADGELFYDTTAYPAFLRIAKRMLYKNVPLPELKKL